MIKKILYLFIFSFQLTACATAAPHQTANDTGKTPKVAGKASNSLEGYWESTGPFSYFMFELKPEGHGLLAVVSNKNDVNLFNLKSVKPRQGILIMHFEGVKNNKKSMTLAGKLMFNHLFLREMKKTGIEIWFVRKPDLAKYRSLAEAAMNQHPMK